MKRLLALAVSLFTTLAVNGKCANSGLWVFPASGNIKQNPVFVIDGYATSETVITELNKKHKVYLKSRDKKIRLIVIEILKGQFRLTQAVLKPETELEAGVEYTLHIEGFRDGKNLELYNYSTQEFEPVKYVVASGKDLEKPIVSSRPIEIKKTLVQYGCGPSIHVVFSNTAKDQSALIVKTTVKNLKTGKETTFYIQPDDDRIKVGHGMCSGAFAFDYGDNYEVAFSFMDASGNITEWSGERIKFTRPTESTSHEEE